MITSAHHTDVTISTEIKRFLSEIRPPGRGYLFSLQGKTRQQAVFNSNEEAIALILRSISQSQDTFISLAQFQENSPSREAKYAEYFASCWIDIDVDCGNEKTKPYTSREEGMEALDTFITQTKLPRPSMLINSGGGVHAYWCFSQIISISEWERCAKSLKAVCLTYGLKIDATVTTDAARVMRIPRTQNWKLSNNPRPVLIIEPTPDQALGHIDFDMFRDQVIELQEKSGPQARSRDELPECLIAHIQTPITALTKSLTGTQETTESIQKVKTALSHIDPDVSYPDWFRLLCAVKSTDWSCAKQIAQEWSAGGEKFNEPDFHNQWSKIDANGGVTLATLFHMAQPAAPRSTTTTNITNSSQDTVDQPGDIRNAKLFAAQNAGKLLFLRPMGRWFFWDGLRWKICLCGEEMEAAKKVAAMLVLEAAAIATQNAERGKKLFNFALSTQNLPRLEAMLALASSDDRIAIGRPEEMDPDPSLLGVTNGVVNLRTGSLVQADPAMHITKQAAADFDANATCPRWHAFLTEIFEDDLETIESVQRLLGYTLTGSTSEEKIVICYGHGANGKSVFNNVVAKITNEYHTIGPNCLLIARGKNDTSVRNDMAKLLGARLISVNELSAGARLDEQIIKQLAGREAISARFLHKEFFDFLPTGKVWLRTNHRPIIAGEDDGIWRRLVLLPFNRKFTEEEQDRDLEQTLLQERSGILAWMVRGAIKWQQSGLKLSPTMMAELRTYRTESDLLGEFLEEKTERNANGRIQQATLFTEWQDWCEASGLKSGSKAAFTRRISERGFGSTQSNGLRYYQGLERWHGQTPAQAAPAVLTPSPVSAPDTTALPTPDQGR
jgi:putative DNA primase/helicase